MTNFLIPGYVRWDGNKYTTDPSIQIVGPPGQSTNNGFIYKPGGIASGNVYTSWTALMAARATTPTSQAVIIIDDSIISPAVVDVGNWHLGKNTAIISYNGPNHTQTTLSLPNNAILLDPNIFINIKISAVNTSSPNINNSSFTTLDIDCYNATFINTGSSAHPILHIPAGTINMYGGTQFISIGEVANAVIISETVNNIYINMYDNSYIHSNMINATGSNYVGINIYGSSSNYVSSQSGISAPLVLFGGAVANGVNSAPVGAVPTKSGAGSITWTVPTYNICSVVEISHTLYPAGYYSINTDEFINVHTTPAATTVFMPLSPATGMNIYIADTDGAAVSHNITIDGNGKTLGDASTSTVIINTNWKVKHFIYNGSFWSLIS